MFTHNDLDGVSCGIRARLAFEDFVEVRYNSVEGLNREVERFLASKSSRRKTAGCFTSRRCTRTDYSWASVRVAYDGGRPASATSLFYDYLLRKEWIRPSDAIDRFVVLARLYDTWQREAEGNLQAKQLNDLFFFGRLKSSRSGCWTV